MWKPKAKPTSDEVEHAKSLLPPFPLWQIGLIEQFEHIQWRGAMHPNYNTAGEHPGVEVWTDIPEDQVKVGKKLKATSSEIEKVLQAAEDQGYPRDEVYSTIMIESGWDSSARNPVSNAVGLIQFLPSTLRGLGYTGHYSDFQKLSAGEQAEWVGKYFAAVKNRWRFPGDTYVATAATGFIGAPNSTIAYKKLSKAVEQNRLWDVDKSGDITVGEIRAFLLKRMKTAPASSGEGTAKATPKVPIPDYSLEEWRSLLVLTLLDDAEHKRYVTLPVRTLDKLKEYQFYHQLKVDGVLGPLTIRSLLG